jgi:hypothetical protein
MIPEGSAGHGKLVFKNKLIECPVARAGGPHEAVCLEVSHGRPPRGLSGASLGAFELWNSPERRNQSNRCLAYSGKMEV